MIDDHRIRLTHSLTCKSAARDQVSAKLRFLTPVLAFGMAGLVAACASREPQSRYRFDVVNQPVAASAHSAITVRLIDVVTGRPVDAATISDARLKMRMASPALPPGKSVWPDRSHSEDVRFVGSPGGGQYRFVGDVSMPGTWILVLSANVPGEASPIETSVKFVAARQRHDP